MRHRDGSLETIQESTQPSYHLNPEAELQDHSDIIATLRARFGVETDQALADALQVKRSTVTSWRRRKRVPDQSSRLLTKKGQESLGSAFRYERLTEDKRMALCLAIMRMHSNGFLSRIETYPDFLLKGPFIPKQITSAFSVAMTDLFARMEDEGYDDPQQCLNAMIFEELYS